MDGRPISQLAQARDEVPVDFRGVVGDGPRLPSGEWESSGGLSWPAAGRWLLGSKVSAASLRNLAVNAGPEGLSRRHEPH